MKKILLIIIVSFYTNSNLMSQSTVALDASFGAFYIDRFLNEKDILKFYQGNGINLDFIVWNEIKCSPKLNSKIGLGINYFSFFNSIPLDSDKNGLLYLSLNLGTEYKLGQKTSIQIALNNYIYPSKLENLLHERLFANIEIGFQYYLTKRFAINLSGSISPYPLFQGQVGYFTTGGMVIFDMYAEQIGINLGFYYRFQK